MSTPELKPMPKGVETVRVTKSSAARSQLESAIWLWFNDGDPVSIHTLAVAAHDCFSALFKHTEGMPSELPQWLATQSKGRQKRARIAQNFFKHGSMDLKAQILLPSIDSEVLMMDAASCCEVITKDRTALMHLYAQRFLYEHPALITEEALPVFAKNAEIHQLVNSTRKEFFQKLFPVFAARYKA